jgi:ectoine hydroxylase-related dioxygenase (phytanoyl-CoA dioxygenase family)
MSPFEQSVQEIEIFGFTILDAVLSSGEVAAMQEALIRCDREAGTDHTHRGTARHVANLPTLDPVFFACIDHRKVLPLLEHFLGEKLILGSLNARIVRAGDLAQELHGDMLNMASPVMMNTVWMLDDFSAANGGTRVVPGSHKSGMATPPEGWEVPHVLQPEAKAGSVLVFNGQARHGGGGNTSASSRHALFGHYRKHMLLFQNDPHDDFPQEWFETLTTRQKELMRMAKGLGTDHAADTHLR